MMKKTLKTITVLLSLLFSVFLYSPNLFAGDDPAVCPPEHRALGIYNMKNMWFGGCKTKCGYFCEVDGDAGIDLPTTIKVL
ncbi:MAG: hypothetical protein ACI9GZ_004150 [Bacteroidia bacterium]|jgi:hypothetical protein